jgi:hypothetical protein
MSLLSPGDVKNSSLADKCTLSKVFYKFSQRCDMRFTYLCLAINASLQISKQQIDERKRARNFESF